MQNLTVIKLGGSLITDKSTPYTLRKETISSVCAEIKEAMDSNLGGKFVIVQGVGSYGHPPVIQHKLYKGFIDQSQLLPLSKTQSKVDELRAALIKGLQDNDIPVIHIAASSVFTSTKGKLDPYNLKPLTGYMGVGMVPLIGGDMIYDHEMGFTVCSGDKLALTLARELEASRLIFAADVEGVYDKDPKSFKDAELHESIPLTEIPKLMESFKTNNPRDASGAIIGKLATILESKPLIESGMEVSILSMMKKGNLLGRLRGEKGYGTLFVA
ncbi:MAG: isopentenyl phosphate kinase [Candidatus Bathyarchaeota archaeon]|nr:isopentenyl phosphate kinase [Candidatus Bathyarchaeota archaeon]